MNKLQKFVADVFGIKGINPSGNNSPQELRFSSQNPQFIPENIYKLLGGEEYLFNNDNTKLFTEAFGSNPYVFNVIDRIVSRAIDIDQYLINKRSKEEAQEPILNSILEGDYFDESLRTFNYRLLASFLIGEVFICQKKSVGFNEPTGFFIPISYNVMINEDANGNPVSYTVKYRNVNYQLNLDEVKHIKKPNISYDVLRGWSALNSNRKVWQSDNEVWQSEASLHKNKGVSGIVYGDGVILNPTEQKELQNEYDRQFSGSSKFGRVKLVSTKVGYVPMGMNPNDLKSIEARIDHLRATCAAYNVDSKLFGDPQARGYNNMEQAKLGLITDAVIPLFKWVYPEMISFFAESFGISNDYSLSFKAEDIPEMQKPNTELSNKLINEVNAGILTQEQAFNILHPNLEYVPNTQENATQNE